MVKILENVAADNRKRDKLLRYTSKIKRQMESLDNYIQSTNDDDISAEISDELISLLQKIYAKVGAFDIFYTEE